MVALAAAAVIGFGFAADADPNLSGVLLNKDIAAYQADGVRHRLTIKLTRTHELVSETSQTAQSVAVNCGFEPNLPKLRYLLEPLELESLNARRVEFVQEIAEAADKFQPDTPHSPAAVEAANASFQKMMQATLAASAKEVQTRSPGLAGEGQPRLLDFGHQRHRLSLLAEVIHATQSGGGEWREEASSFSMECGLMRVPVELPIGEREYFCPNGAVPPQSLIAGEDEPGRYDPAITFVGKNDVRLGLGFGRPSYSSAGSTFSDRISELPSPSRRFDDLVRAADLGVPETQAGEFRQAFRNFSAWELALEGADMNELGTLPGVRSSFKDYLDSIEVNLPAGTIFMPDDGDFQWMMSVGRLDVQYRFEEDLLASLAPQDPVPATVRTMCLEMGKLEPRSGVKYMPYANPDPVLRELAQLTADSLSRGPWDQARIWTYTDGASLADINKKLAEPLIPGYFVRNLRDLHRVGALPSEAQKRRNLFSIELLFSPAGDPEAALLVSSTICRESPKAAAAALNQPDEYGLQLFSAAGATLKVQHMEMMLFAGLMSEHIDVRKAALTFLGTVVPEAARGWVAGLSVMKFIPGMKAEDEIEGMMINTVRAMYAL